MGHRAVTAAPSYVAAVMDVAPFPTEGESGGEPGRGLRGTVAGSGRDFREREWPE